jgi:hypothetical protein
MKKLFAIVLFCLPVSASAEHMDVIQVSLNEGCSVAQYVQIATDFNAQWGKEHGYRAEIAVPLQSEDLTAVFWLGHSANAQAFGAAWDAWRDALADSKSVAAKLNARFQKCAANQTRSGYDVY